MTTATIERDLQKDQEEQKRLRHERYRALVEGDSYSERLARYGATTTEEPPVQQHAAPRQQKSTYVADRLKDASAISRGQYEPQHRYVPDYYRGDYNQQAPAWDYLETIQPEQQVYVEEVESEDLKPTVTTAQYASVSRRQAAEAEVEGTFSLTASSRIVIAVLAVVVIAIFTLFGINSMVLSSLSQETAALENTYAELQANDIALDAQIVDATSEDTIIEWAESAGMVKA